MRCTEISRSIARASSDNFEWTRVEYVTHNGTVTVLIVKEAFEGPLLAAAAPTPPGQSSAVANVQVVPTSRQTRVSFSVGIQPRGSGRGRRSAH